MYNSLRFIIVTYFPFLKKGIDPLPTLVQSGTKHLHLVLLLASKIRPSIAFSLVVELKKQLLV